MILDLSPKPRLGPMIGAECVEANVVVARKFQNDCGAKTILELTVGRAMKIGHRTCRNLGYTCDMCWSGKFVAQAMVSRIVRNLGEAETN